jgi:hypothetical protein
MIDIALAKINSFASREQKLALKKAIFQRSQITTDFEKYFGALRANQFFRDADKITPLSMETSFRGKFELIRTIMSLTTKIKEKIIII